MRQIGCLWFFQNVLESIFGPLLWEVRFFEGNGKWIGELRSNGRKGSAKLNGSALLAERAVFLCEAVLRVFQQGIFKIFALFFDKGGGVARDLPFELAFVFSPRFPATLSFRDTLLPRRRTDCFLFRAREVFRFPLSALRRAFGGFSRGFSPRALRRGRRESAHCARFPPSGREGRRIPPRALRRFCRLPCSARGRSLRASG